MAELFPALRRLHTQQRQQEVTQSMLRIAVINSATSNTVSVTVISSSAASVIGNSTFCSGFSTTLAANTGTGLTYQWKLNGIAIGVATASSYVATSAGNYTVVVTNNCGFSATSNNFPVSENLNCSMGLQCDGSDDLAAIPNNAAYNLATGDFTIELWIKANSSQSYSLPIILSKRETGNTNTGFLIYMSPAGQLVVNVGATNLSGAGANLKDNSCHHIAVTRATSSVKYYVDGVLISTQTSTQSINSTHAIWAGKDEALGYDFNGNIRDIRFWNLSRTQTQIQASKDVSLSGSETGLIGYWKTIEGTGQSITDYSALNNTGYLGTTAAAESTDPSWAAGCVASCSFPPATIVAGGPTVFCAGDSVLLSANTAAGLSYQWQLNSGNIAGATASSLTAKVAGNYSCLVSNTCGRVPSNVLPVSTVSNCIAALNLRVFIQSLYAGNRTMRTVMDPALYPGMCDTITVELHNATAPYAIADSRSAVIDVNGYGRFVFNAINLGNSYYIVVRYRNSLDTWSRTPVLFNSYNVSFDFTSP